ncbi:DedA family protein [Nocardia sp. NBC_01327]|uniref:DedA family protein n=1 Tax=Nocardia sp. NBC_01327 TaxID=2903593 RepID=UPI002E0E879C|nr:DedA family protein [Nocardia sp. NBC_01327]
MLDITAVLDGVHGPALYVVFALLTVLLFWIPTGLIIPGEPFFVLAGILAASGQVSLPIVILVIVTSAIVSPIGTYYAGRVFDDWIGRRPAESKLRRALEKGEDTLRRRGAPAAVFACWIPLLRTTLPIMIGASKYSFPRFVAFSATGTTIWSALFIIGGYYAGPFFQKFAIYAGMALLASLAILILYKLVRRFVRRPAPVESAQK